MECNKCQETGLLYLSHELEEAEAAEFLDHLNVCTVCRDEVARYEQEKKAIFSLEMMGENPSGQTDAKIIAVCSKRLPITGISLFSGVWGKRTVYSLLFLFFGLGAGVYFSLNFNNAFKPNSISVSSEQTPAPIASSAHNKPFVIQNDSQNIQDKDLLKPAESPLVAEPPVITPVQDIIPVSLVKE